MEFTGDSPRRENFDEALENLQLALHLAPNSVDVLAFLSKIFMDKEDYESAMPFLRKVTSLTPDPEIQELRKHAENEIKRQSNTYKQYSHKSKN